MDVKLKMKNFKKLLNVSLVALIVLTMTSCGFFKKTTFIIPTAVSTLTAPVYMNDLNLDKDSYQIINTVTSEAVIVYETQGILSKSFKISEKNNEFSLDISNYAWDEASNRYVFDVKYNGVVKFGYLREKDVKIDYTSPSEIASGLATYRLINTVQDQGADGVIEPIVTIKVGQEGKKLIYTATITAKLVKIKAK